MNDGDDRRERLIEALAYTPTRADILLLLEKYFVGPVSDETVDRVERQFTEVNASDGRSSMHQSRMRSLVRWSGAAWYEEAIDKRTMTPRDLVLMLADDIADAEGTFPQRRMYCPPKLVGVWQQLEPAHSERILWHLDADGSFRSNSPDVAQGLSLWCVEISSDGELYFALREHAASGGGVWGPLARMQVDGDKLTATYVTLDIDDERVFRWRREARATEAELE